MKIKTLLKILSVLFAFTYLSASAETKTDVWTFDKKTVTSSTYVKKGNYTEYLPDGWYAPTSDYAFQIEPLDGKQYLAFKAYSDFNTKFIPFYAHGGTITIKARSKWDGYSYSIYVYKATRDGDSFTAGSNLITAIVTSATDQNLTYTLPEDGYYALSGEIGAYILSITNTYEAAVTTTYTVSGSVIDADGNPVEGATVSLPGANAQTDAEGKYSIEGIEDGTYDLTVSKEGFENTTASVTVNGADVTVDPITLQLVKWYIGGFVQDYNYNKVAGANVQLYDGDTILSEVTTDAEGNYRFTIPAEDKNYTLKIQAEYFNAYSTSLSVKQSLLNNEKVRVFNPMIQAIKVTFNITVKDTWNQPVTGAAVTLNGPNIDNKTVSQSGNNGLFVLRNLAAYDVRDYEYTWTVSAEGYENASGTVVFNGENVYAEATLIPTGMTVISGKVTDTDGNALANAHVSLTIGDATTAVATVDTNAEGYYSFARTDLEAPASIEVSLTNYESDTKGIAEITPNANNVCDFTLVPLVYTYTATVKNQDGDALADATVTFDGNELTGENGIFKTTIAAADAADREIPVEISCLGYVTQNVNLTFTADIDQTYTLVKADAGESAVVIEVYDKTDNPINDATVTVSNDDFSTTAEFDSDGVYVAMIPNTYNGAEFTIKVDAHGYVIATKQFTFEGEESSHVFNLEEAEGNGVNEILDELDGEAKVFTIDGLRIEVKKGERLPAGFYIVNGRKLIVR